MSFTESDLPQIIEENRNRLLSKASDWERVPLGEVAKVLNGFAFKSSYFNQSDGIPIVRIRNVLDGATDTYYAGPFEEAYRVRRGDLLVSMDGDFHCARWRSEDAVLNQRVCKLTPNEQFYDPAFLLYVLPGYLSAINEWTHAITVKHLSSRTLQRVPLPLAPLVEQRAIVAKIESLFSELDQGVAQLESVRTQLGRYRKSVLKAGFEGRLTAAWREERRQEAEANGEPLPTADDLLVRIRAERETAHAARLAEWEHAVAAWEEAGGKASGTKKPRKPAAPKDPPPLTKEELADLPELPEGWAWCRLGLAIEDPQYGTSKKCRYDTPGRSVLRIPNMDVGRIDPSDLKFASFDEDEAKTYELLPSDVLIIRSNGSVSLVGLPALITDRDTEHLFAGYLVRLRPIAATLYGEYLTQCLLSHRSRLQIESVARSTSGVNNINSGEIRGLIVPLCAPAEQTEIVNEIDARLSVVDEVEKVVATTIKQAEALRQSILTKAFEGRLLSEAELGAVRADPAYEPADQLLARIRESNAAAAPKKKTRRKRTPKVNA